jgi:hypothetical protein
VRKGAGNETGKRNHDEQANDEMDGRGSFSDDGSLPGPEFFVPRRF